MSKFQHFIQSTLHGLRGAIQRFPMTFVSLVLETALVWYLIAQDSDSPLWVEKSVFILIVSAVLGIAAQLGYERFTSLPRSKGLAYGVALGLVGVYALIIAPAVDINFTVGVRTTVAVFATVAAGLYLPAHRSAYDFNRVALITFLSFFTAVLYSAVLTAGLSSILVAINLLLFRVDSDVYSYAISAIWILFAPNYFLSLMPNFHAQSDDAIRFREERASYPRILSILISYITVPLVTAYTLVLVAYFGRILFTLSWPVGQLGPLVLGYGLIGLVVYVLASSLDNSFTQLYVRWFPRLLIPIVILQLASVIIRLNAYGFTESRYYLLLFGVYFLVIGALLSYQLKTANRWIALLAAAFALISIVPPVDAFSVSRSAQVARLEGYLSREGMLVEGQLLPNSDATLEAQKEITNIVEYLYWRDYTQSLNYLPQDFELYRDFKSVFGFGMSYGMPDRTDYFFASLNRSDALVTGTYDAWLIYEGNRFRTNATDEYTFIHNFDNMVVQFERTSPDDVELRVLRNDRVILTSNLSTLTQAIRERLGSGREVYSAFEMSAVIRAPQLQVTMIFSQISIDDQQQTLDFEVFVMLKFFD